jgi:hypothetical protein
LKRVTALSTCSTSGELLTGDEWIPAQVFPLGDMHVHPADAAVHHLHQKFTWRRLQDGRLLCFDSLELKNDSHFPRHLLFQKIIASATLDAGVEA